jgi:hypothetical protein
MCLPSSSSPPPAPPPLPAQAPPPPPAILETADSGSSTTKALVSNRGRGSLRIDKTQVLTPAGGSTTSGLNIPTT